MRHFDRERGLEGGGRVEIGKGRDEKFELFME